ncbi:lipopolysaccharide biosynthesis protein, partial [Bacteroides ovatus]
MSDYKALLKHSGNYFFAMVATKALDFIAIPVYTYLLTVEEYGIYSIFISTVGIATVILPLNSEVAISRYYFDAKDEKDFKQFVGTSVRLTSLIVMIMAFLMIIFVKPLSEFQDFEVLLTLSIIPVSLYKIVNSVFQQIYQPLLQSRKIAVVSSIQAYLAFALSIVCIFFLPEKKYYGQVWGTIVAMLIVGSYSVRQIKEYYLGSWNI